VPASARVSTDLYAVLGVDASVGGDEIARAFRSRAKTLHPDTSADPDAAAQFNELVAAYGVLSNHRTRREYDARRAETRARITTPGQQPATATAPARATTRWTRRRAWTALLGGLLVTVLGVGAAILTWHLHQDDARRRAEFRAVTATRVGDGDITFTTADGKTVRTREPEQHGEGTGVGPTVGVRYDPTNPTHVIVDANTVGRDITLAIVSLKLLIGGPVFMVLGGRRLRRARGAR
jgi:curved DNA-binding protein CbpA